MELVLKTQQLKPKERKDKRQFATAIEIEPENTEDSIRRGYLFLTISIQSKKDADLSTPVSIFTDTLRKEYYKQSTDTPLYAVEKALDKASQNARSISDKGGENNTIAFCTALIWNRVLYISHTGSPAAYLIRNNGVKDLAKANPSDEIVTMSGLLTADDVIIIGTQSFRSKFSPQEIVNSLGSLSSTIDTTEDRESIASILIKVSTHHKQKKASIIKTLTETKFPGMVTSKLSKIRNKIFVKKSLSETYKEYQRKKPAPVASISELANKAASISPGIGNSQKRRRIGKNTKKKRRSTIVGLLFLSLITVIITIPTREKGIEKTEMSPILSIKKNNRTAILGTSDKKNGTTNLSNITNNFKASNGDTYKDGKFLILNKSNNSMYTIDTKEKKNKKVDIKLENPKYLDCDSTFCFITDEDLIKAFKIDSPKDVNSYTNDVKNIQDIAGYNQRLYILTDTDIYSLKLGNKNSVPLKWLDKKESLTNPISMTYTGTSMFVLDGRTINRYISIDGTVGIRKPFKFDNSYLLSPKQIRANKDYLFVLNSDINEISVIIFDNRDGQFIKKVKLTNKEVSANVPFIIPKADGTGFYYVKNEILYESTD